MSYHEAWSTLPLWLPFYDYIGHNLANDVGGADGVAFNWFGPANIQAVEGTALHVRRIPTFFGPTRYQWDNGLVQTAIVRQVQVQREFNAIWYFYNFNACASESAGQVQHILPIPRKYWSKGVVRKFNAIRPFFEKVKSQKILGKRGGTQTNSHKILVNRGGTQFGTF